MSVTTAEKSTVLKAPGLAFSSGGLRADTAQIAFQIAAVRATFPG
jgi:hypothetical protein